MCSAADVEFGVIMARWILLLIGHVTLLIFASTSFTAVTGFREGHFQWEYVKYSSQSGWGVPYEFPYTLPVVLTYLAAYGSGLAVYMIAWRSGSQVVGVMGTILCAIGFVSFSYELTHWFSERYDAWIVSLPAPLLLLACAAVIQHFRLKRFQSV
jgi:hypothetical protein